MYDKYLYLISTMGFPYEYDNIFMLNRALSPAVVVLSLDTLRTMELYVGKSLSTCKEF